MGEFCENYSLKHLVKEPTCFKNPDKPTCIDLMLTNKPTVFPLISAPGAYLKTDSKGAALIRGRR